MGGDSGKVIGGRYTERWCAMEPCLRLKRSLPEEGGEGGAQTRDLDQ